MRNINIGIIIVIQFKFKLYSTVFTEESNHLWTTGRGAGEHALKGKVKLKVKAQKCYKWV